MQASVAQPFFDAAPLSLTSLERLAEVAGFPGAVVSDPQGMISLRAAERFMWMLDRRLEHPTYFLESVGHPAISRDGSVANIALPRLVTGVEAVRIVADRISQLLFGAGFVTETQGSLVWLLRTAGTTDFTDCWPVQQYNLEVGLQSVRRVIGRPLDPVALRLSSDVPTAFLPNGWRELPIIQCQRTMGLAFDLDDLVPCSDGITLDTQEHSVQASVQEADVHMMRACLETFLGNTVPDCLSISMASAFGMSERTYRRHLKNLGLSHRSLVEDARLSKAEAMLKDPGIPITEISLELGYTHCSAFTRFFKERTGRTPQDFRRCTLT